MTTTFYILASIGVLVLCAVSYALGHAEGRRCGFDDGYEARRREERARKAQEREADAWAARCAR